MDLDDMTDRPILVRIPLAAALVLVELAEDMGELTPGEEAVVAETRQRIERYAKRAGAR
jgi:hypothetical protein